MTLEDFDRVLAFHKKSSLPTISLLGGEPTIHPQFGRIIDRCLTADMQIRLFTGGLIPPAAKEKIRTVPPAKIGCIVNLSAPEHCRSKKEYETTVQAVKDLAAFSTVSYTIFTDQVDPAWLVGMVREAQCRQHIRLGLAMPGPADQTPLLPPSKYRTIAAWVIKLAEQCDQYDITIGFDCGFTLCMFSTEQLGKLVECGCDPRFVCCPIIDIGPNLAVWSCFGTSTVNQMRLEDFPARNDAVAHYSKLQRAYRSFGVFDGCHTCRHKRRGTCAGGCLAHVMRSFNSRKASSAKEPGVGALQSTI